MSRCEEVLDAWINRVVNADLIFYGEVLGTKSGESPQLLKDYKFESEYLRLSFNTTKYSIYTSQASALRILTQTYA